MELINKYRPLKFEDVVGHKSVIRSIKEILNKNLAKSFLFVGGAGQGKTTLARIISTQVGCNKPIEIDAATHSGVDDMRGITETLSYKPLQGKSKVLIIDECQKLSSSAWDSLLKATEEPPEHVFWIFCTTNPDKVPKTIKTRCQVFELKPISEDDIYNLLVKVCLEESFTATEEVLDLIAAEAQGSARQALSFLALCCDIETRKEAVTLLSKAYELPQVIDIARAIAKNDLDWKKTVGLLKEISTESAESIKIQIVNYLGVVLMNTQDESKACYLLQCLEAFNKPYNQSEKMAPLLLSLGEIVFKE